MKDYEKGHANGELLLHRTKRRDAAMTATHVISIFDRFALPFINTLALVSLPLVAAGLFIGSF
ncbi:MAG: hypothetical protein ACRED9_09995 [Caulobacteraceae bacterium]